MLMTDSIVALHTRDYLMFNHYVSRGLQMLNKTNYSCKRFTLACTSIILFK